MSVLVIVTSTDDAPPMVRWGAYFARARRCQVHVARVGAVTEDDAIGQAIEAALDEALPDEPPPKGSEAPVAELSPESYLRPETLVVAEETAYPEIRQLIAANGITLLVVPKTESARSEQSLGERLLARAPCDIILMRTTPDSGTRCERILVPAAGGPHARVALRLVDQLARIEDAEVTALYIEPEIGEVAEDVGLTQVKSALKEARVQQSDRLQPRVHVADSVSKGIGTVALEGFDLLMVGASDRSFVRRTLFGTVPAKLLQGPEGMTVAVMRSAKPLAVRAREAFDKWLGRRIPQLNREQRIALFENLQNGSRFSFDFLALICLSTSIASLGLIQNSGAVVIGAMLVAPLLTPMLGAGLSLVQGNIPLIKDAARSIGMGFLMALVVGFIFGWLTPIHVLTPELEGRGSPNILDLIIALLSGAAAAYAVARPNLSGALPGVAIAAALVPPIATSGIALAVGDFSNATGAAALFGLNLVAIILGCSLALYCIGVRGFRKHTHRSLWVRRTLLALVIVALVISFPLVSILLRKFAEPVSEAMLTAVQERVDEEDGVELSHVMPIDDSESADLEVELLSAEPVRHDFAEDVAEIAEDFLGEDVRVRIVTRLATVIEYE